MKILLGSKLIVDIFINRSISDSPFFQMFCDMIFSDLPEQFHVTRTSLDRIHSYTSYSTSVKNADSLVFYLESILTICEVSSRIFENARHRVTGIDSGEY
ncbi:hypothetical protein FEV09_12670 [Pseudanabaena catenata USMAC16]|uniref:Uncharacterized protein n=2 Tax=Pseudanabaena TaxID=1152 RepID=L8N011_9CYAN|nr:hypothetical protein [Pseudanabaena catenata]ELS32349.1 hypothetical protein Pse7429DRAFT_2399 [Pseudanabaena biceps PCC 7429]MDG3495414.1 hypothetical protein [Pseudanabaena catenata USMAC16]